MEQHPTTLPVLIFPSAAVRGRVSGEERAHLSLVETAGQRTIWLRDRCTHAKPHRKGEWPVGRLCHTVRERGAKGTERVKRPRGRKITQGQFESFQLVTRSR